MRLTKEEREAKWPSATYPFLSSKFDFVTNYLKNIILIWKLLLKDQKIGISNPTRNYQNYRKQTKEMMTMMMILGQAGIGEMIGKKKNPTIKRIILLKNKQSNNKVHLVFYDHLINSKS